MKIKRSYTGELLGMTTKSEQEYFTFYGKNIYTGEGEVVDLGCWLGSTTIPLVRGLLDNPNFVRSTRKVFSYDTFIWYDVMNESAAGTGLAGKYKEGDSFLDEYKRRIQKYSSYIEICAGDLKDIGWQGPKIEFLLVDAMKNWELANSILKDFYTHLIPNRSLVLHQDFAHYFTPWIHLLHWHFRDHFELVEDIPNSSSVVFRCIKKIPENLLQKNYSFESFSDADLNEAIDHSLRLVSDEKRVNIRAAKVMSFIHQQRFDEAKGLLQDYIDQGVSVDKELLTVQDLVRKAEQRRIENTAI